MGKSVAAPTKPVKREEIDKLVVSAMKHKKDVSEDAVAKKEESSEESTDEDEFCSDVDELTSKVSLKKTTDSSKADDIVAKKLPAAAPIMPASKKEESIEESTDEDEFNSDADELPSKVAAKPEKAPQAVKKTSDIDDVPIANNVTAAAPTKPLVPASEKEESTDEDEFISDADELPSKVAVKNTGDNSEEVDVVAKKLSAAAPKKPLVPALKKEESIEESTDEDEFNSDVDELTPKVAAQPEKAPQAVQKTSDISEEDDVVAKKVPAAAPITPLVPASEKEESIEESTGKNEFVSDADELPSKVADDESENDSEGSDDEEPQKKKMKSAGTPAATEAPKEGSSSEKKSSEEEEKDADVEMVDAATPVTPKAYTSGSKTLFVGNLSFSIEQEDIVNFFKDAGEVQDVRFATHPDGAFKGFGHVEFVTAEAAHKALELNGEHLLGRPVRLDLAKERHEYTPNSGREANSHQRPARSEGTTVYVRGFDKNEEEDKIRSTLEEHFSSCGEIIKTAIPTEPDGSFKGMAYIEFTNGDAYNKALELDQSEVGGFKLTVQKPRPRSDSSGRDRGFGARSSGHGGRGRRGGRDGGGHFCSGGRFGGGGRFCSGDRGRGYTPSFTRNDE